MTVINYNLYLKIYFFLPILAIFAQKFVITNVVEILFW